MSLASADLPSDPDALRAFALACQSELAAATAELAAAKLAVQLRTLEIEKLKFQIAKLRRMQFGRSSERLTRQIEQLELRLEELEAGEAEEIAKAAAESRPLPIREGDRPKRKPLPDHLPREEIAHEPEHNGACTCPACGGDMARLGEDVTEVLDYIPGRFRVIRHVRPKYACRCCDVITRRQRRLCRHRAGVLPPACWRMCWCRNTPIICRFIGRARSMLATGSISIARP
jgi:transposase